MSLSLLSEFVSLYLSLSDSVLPVRLSTQLLPTDSHMRSSPPFPIQPVSLVKRPFSSSSALHLSQNTHHNRPSWEVHNSPLDSRPSWIFKASRLSNLIIIPSKYGFLAFPYPPVSLTRAPIALLKLPSFTPSFTLTGAKKSMCSCPYVSDH